MWSARCAFHTFLAREGAANKFQDGFTHEFVALFFIKTIVILRKGDPDGGGGGGNHPSGSLEPRPLRFLRIASDGDGIASCF